VHNLYILVTVCVKDNVLIIVTLCFVCIDDATLYFTLFSTDYRDGLGTICMQNFFYFEYVVLVLGYFGGKMEALCGHMVKFVWSKEVKNV